MRVLEKNLVLLFLFLLTFTLLGYEHTEKNCTGWGWCGSYEQSCKETTDKDFGPPSPKYFIQQTCNPNQDTVCQRCSEMCPQGTYKIANCTSTKDISCKNCFSSCAAYFAAFSAFGLQRVLSSRVTSRAQSCS